MFPKNKINLFYRILCLITFSIIIFMINSVTSLILLLIIFCILAFLEMSFRNIELVIITIAVLGLSSLLDFYGFFRVMLFLDYCFYFLDTSYYYEENTKISSKKYVRFSKINNKKDKEMNNMSAIYITVHLVLLFVIIVVG